MAKSDSPKVELTDTQKEFLQIYARLLDELGEGPSIRKMAEACGYSDPSGAQQMMYKLRDLGVLRLKEVIPGGLTPVGEELLGRKRRRAVARRNTRD